MPIADLVGGVVGPDVPISIRAYDGSSSGTPDAGTAVVIRSEDALRRIVGAPGELGIARAYVAGDIDVEGDIFELLELRKRFADVRLDRSQWLGALRLVGLSGLRRLPPPPEEARLRGRRHTRARDRAAIAHHYDVSNDFYRVVLGPSMTYSCAVWESPDITLEDAQAAKYELICRKLDLQPGMRLLDVGCGWGGMVLHAARHHGVDAVGITVSRRQAELGSKRVAEAGLSNRIEIRLQDYRDIGDEVFDAISSIGMFEHVGLAQLETYFRGMHARLRPEGRLLNHAISRPAGKRRARFNRRSFMNRYVFPDGELHEVGSVISAFQECGFEMRHAESLREHYALTLRAWVRNLEQGWAAATDAAGEARARIWRLYMAACALTFEDGNTQVHQVLGVKAHEGRSGMPLRPTFT